jgi:hypothetical protein
LIAGIDGVENREPIRGSQAEESNESFGRNIRAKFNGTAMGSGSGLLQVVQNFDTTRISDVSLVFSTDYQLFRRRTRRAAWDVYLIGEDSQEITDTFTGNGTQTQFVLNNQPVLSVSSVLVNSISVPFSFTRDSSDATKYSSRSTDKVVLSAPPGPNAVVSVTYNYDKLVTDTQGYINELRSDLYESDILIRKAYPIDLKVTVSIQVLSTFDRAQAISDTLSAIQAYGDLENFVELLSPADLRNIIEQNVAGISAVRILEFTRLDTGTLPAEPIEFLANEFPVLSSANITIVTRS